MYTRVKCNRLREVEGEMLDEDERREKRDGRGNWEGGEIHTYL